MTKLLLENGDREICADSLAGLTYFTYFVIITNNKDYLIVVVSKQQRGRGSYLEWHVVSGAESCPIMLYDIYSEHCSHTELSSC